MKTTPIENNVVEALGPTSDAADHVVEARERARRVLGGEATLSESDDWRRVLVSARDGLILVWIVWVALLGFGHPPYAGWLLLAVAVGVSLLTGVSIGRSTYVRVQYYVAELERERREIRENFEHERDEVRALYAAKGFRDPLLGEIVDTLSADDDRLLKVMMEEELGLSMHHIQHPLVVGAWNLLGALGATLLLTLPLLWLETETQHVWLPAAGASLLAIISGISSRATGRSFTEYFTVSLLLAGLTGGVVFLLACWFGQMAGVVLDA